MADEIQKEWADLYQPLFNLMSKEHGVLLTITEMDEIIKCCKEVHNDIDSYLKSI